MTSDFEEIQSALEHVGVEGALSRLVGILSSQRKYHELFDARLMQERHRLGLPIILTERLDQLSTAKRGDAEIAYVEVCREVGRLFLADGKYREAWMYLRPARDEQVVASALEQAQPGEENLDELIEVALHEGVHARHGFALLLKHVGTCNAITAFEAIIRQRPPGDQRFAAELLVRQLHQELLENVQADIERREGRPPEERTLEELVHERPQLFEQNNYHIDTTHLAAVVRFARLAEDPAVLRLGLDLTKYGRRLAPMHHFAGEEPFVELHPSHGLLLGALGGHQVDEALTFFRGRAETVEIEQEGTQAAEIYIWLLARLGRYGDAIDASIHLLGPSRTSQGIAPTLLELSRLAEEYRPLKEASHERGDLLGFVAALVEERLQLQSAGTHKKPAREIPGQA